MVAGPARVATSRPRPASQAKWLPSMRLSLPTAVVFAALLPLAVAGCASGSSDAPAPSTSPNIAVPTRTNPDAGLPTGTQLKAALAQPAYFPAGFAQEASAIRDTGDTYVQQTTTTPAKPDCTLLGGTGWFTISGIAGVSYAKASYVDKATNAVQDEEIFAYSGDSATAELGAVGSIAKTCPTYTDAQTHSPVKVTEAASSGLGDAGYTITLTDSAWQSGSTLQASKVGSDIVFVYSTSGPRNGATDATKLSKYVVSKLKALH
jgi:hypothetical protein